MSCIFSEGVVLCQTNILGVLMFSLSVVLLIVVAYLMGRVDRLREYIREAI